MNCLSASRRFDRLRASANARGILHLASGTTLAQLLTVAVTPVVTRLYTPSDYASMALFSSMVAIAATLTTGRYEAAVPLPPESGDGEREALQLVKLAILIATAANLFLLVIILASKTLGLDVWEQELGAWIYVLPISVWIMVTSQVLYQYANRRRAYSAIAKIAPTSKVVTAVLQIGLGHAGAGRLGLLLPIVLAPLVGLSLLIRVLRSGLDSSQATRSDRSRRDLWHVAVEYREFPFIVSWISLINTLNANIQIIIIAAAFSGEAVGQYALAMGIVALPVSLIAVSVTTVYYRELASRVGDVTSSLALTRRTIFGLTSVATPIVFVLAATAVPLSPLIFGSQWSGAGQFAVALLPWVWVRFIGVPLSAALAVCRQQAWQLIWQVGTLTMFAAVYLGGAFVGWTALTCTWVSSGLAVPFYLALIPLAVTAIRRKGTDTKGSGSVGK